ncbi:hypothetical protein G6O67_000416 [Ophiocordyceps sinensis]|uniref:Uncharacterized protein n=1 Tax=Ophiocordyceps sinensis TaxID=72228 RepID=A0A8H4PZ63_9HYPO|nr:hypothetical protein G6O67_000416 [Ophiocordyceps sinensis]
MLVFILDPIVSKSRQPLVIPHTSLLAQHMPSPASIPSTATSFMLYTSATAPRIATGIASASASPSASVVSCLAFLSQYSDRVSSTGLIDSQYSNNSSIAPETHVWH